MSPKAQFVILNGTSSSGKSSTASAMQAILPDTFLHFQMDAFWAMVPKHVEANTTLFPRIKSSMLASVEALLKDDHNVILDAVFIGQNVNALRDRFVDYNPFIVNVNASPEITALREKQRGDRKIGLAASQAQTIHEGVIYDFAVETTKLTAQQSAEKIVKAYEAFRLTAS